MAPLKVPLRYTHKTKGGFERAEGAIQSYGSPGSVKSSLSFVCDLIPTLIKILVLFLFLFFFVENLAHLLERYALSFTSQDMVDQCAICGSICAQILSKHFSIKGPVSLISL